MDVSIVGAAGACGRQLAVQLLERRVLGPDARLQLVGHRGHRSEQELWGLHADLSDAYADTAPALELVDDPEAVDADVVVMLAGATLSTDPTAPADRADLARTNQEVFATYADALAARRRPPLVIVQSNPVELGVHVFADRLGPARCVGAGAWSDTLRFRRELAHDLGVRRPAVRASVLGQHGDHLVPVWSTVGAVGVEPADVAREVARQRDGRDLADLPDEIRTAKAAALARIAEGALATAFAEARALPADLRAAVKPFVTHYTAGHTTEVVTAHAVADLVDVVVGGREVVVPAQVLLDGEVEGLRGVVGVPVVLTAAGWRPGPPVALAGDERAALAEAVVV
ncbi:hypothetical protein PO878_09860 [Iamia majanohamensis]|uniref:Lactate dehydrogenase n=1 Tax=Iamia majanohamensis TaxID=467976 RepID=A0AAE9Y930_9ACTN|nr:hypothetical protein [Iamia majanohamensis]WCO69030.1 hypothetical protein PO878_09860 [Iamia majanohamensis]